MKTSLIFFALITFSRLAFAQSDRLETDWFLYWQTGTKLTFNDYQREPDSTDLLMLNKYGVSSMANVQIHAVLDYPEKARKIRTLKEQWYLAPVFCKKCSPITKQDSSELLQAQIYFDIAEYCARVTRQKIAELEKRDLGNGFIAAAFPGLINDMYNQMGEMFGEYGRDILIDKFPDAFENWRLKVNELLDSTSEFATKSNDCTRFITNKPFSDEYIVSYEVYGKNL